MEIVVALTIGAIIVLAARTLLESLSSATDHVLTASRQIDADANAERFLRLLAQQIETSSKTEDAFAGDETSTQFTTWCTVPGGWQERCRIALAVEPSNQGPRLMTRAINGSLTPVAVRRAISFLELRYLASASDGGTWFRQWGSSASLPQAIGILIDRDTLVLRIAGRS
jgi:hypothetical protein